MTGFGSAEGNVLGGRLSIEIRSGNHPLFNPHLKLPFGPGGGGKTPPRGAGAAPRAGPRAGRRAAGVQVDEQRLAVEVALMADRVDITEELVRLRTHLAACREALASEGAVGKQLGFLAQELLREVNTIGSKANDARITQTVIAMKGELEKFPEQLDNLEGRRPRASSCSP